MSEINDYIRRNVEHRFKEAEYVWCPYNNRIDKIDFSTVQYFEKDGQIAQVSADNIANDYRLSLWSPEFGFSKTDRRLTEDILVDDFNFVDTGEIHAHNKVYRLELDKYPWKLQMVLGNYKEGNPNNGVLGIYCEEHEAGGCPADLWQKSEWTNEDHARAANYTERIPSHMSNIAFHLIFENRLRDIIKELTKR